MNTAGRRICIALAGSCSTIQFETVKIASRPPTPQMMASSVMSGLGIGEDLSARMT